MTAILIRDLAPDLILTDGKFLTMDADLPQAEAVAIRDGHILAVGSKQAIEELAGPNTTIRRLGGRRAIPGIIDSHNHMLSMGKVFNEVPLYSARSIEDIKSLVAERVATSPPGSWILGRGWDESLLAEKRFPNRHDLDEVAPNNPVVLDRVWNMLLANSAALNAADVGRHTPDPPADALYAGRIERDERGDPSGIFRDRAKQLIKDVVPLDSPEDLKHAIRTSCREYNALGITSAVEPGLFPEQIHAYQQVAGDGDLSVRVSLCIGGWGFGTEQQDATTAQRIEDTAVYTGFGDQWLRMDAVKFMPDGGVGDRTALMFEPYKDDPGNVGQFVVSEKALFDNVLFCHERGWSVDCHACGDRMIELVARAYANAQQRMPNPAVRHRIHHIYLPTATTLELMREYRIPALATIPFLTNLGESFVSSLGEERAARIMPLRTFLDAGIPVALGSDAPVTTTNPFVGIYSAVTRKTVYGRQLGAEECISREEAIRLYTADAAWVTYEDHIKGSLTPGKLADIAVLDRDILSVGEEEIREVRAAMTVIDGRIVHDTLGS